MRVLVVHNQGQLPSGETSVVHEEVEALRARGVDVHLHLVSNPRFDTASVMDKARIAASLPWSIPAMRRIGRLVDEFRPDVAHFHSVLPRLTPSVFAACHRRGVPVVQTLHNFRWLCVEGSLFRDGAYCDDCIHRNELHGAYHRCARGSLAASTLLTLLNAFYLRTGLLLRLVDGFIAVSEFVRRTYVRKGFPADRVYVKGNAVRLPANLPSPPDRKGIVYVGRLNPGKGTEHLKRIIGTLKDVPFVVVGDGPDLEHLRRFAADSGAEQVRFLSRVDGHRALEALSAAECAVVPSVCGESFGRVALEAMAVGTPVVASRIGGLAELLADNAGAVAVDPTRSEEFIAAINGIIGSRETVAAMGAAGRAFVADGGFGESPADALLAIYDRVVARFTERGR